MFERFRDSLAYPGRIIQYRNDKFLRVFAYILMFAVLMSATVIITSIRFDKLDNNVIEVIDDQVVKENIDCQISNNTLGCNNEDLTMFYNDGFMSAYVDSNNEYDYDEMKFAEVVIVLNGENLNLSMSGFKYSYKITDFTDEFEGLDFSNLETDSEAFSIMLANGVSEVMRDLKVIWAPIVIGFEIVLNFLFILLIVLINSLIIKNRFKVIPFKEVYKMSIYSSTTLFVLLTLNNMVSLGYFFLFIFVVVTFRQTNALTMAIYKVMKKK